MTHHKEEQRVAQSRPRGSKRNWLDQSQIDRVERLFLDRSSLPADVQEEGFEEIVAQEIVLHTDTTRFLKQTWSSKTTGTTYMAELPPGYTGPFGPRIKALTLAFYCQGQMSEVKILDLYRVIGVVMSAEQLSDMLCYAQELSPAGKDATC